MGKIDSIIQLAAMLLVASICGYVISVMKEYMDLRSRKIVIKSKVVTQDFLDRLDFQVFRIGHMKLKTGDIIKIYSSLRDNKQGTILGAEKEDNTVVLLLENDEIVKYKISDISKLRVISRYGRLF